MKILITGANGTIGKRLTQHLLSQGHQVVAWNRQHIAIDQYAVIEAYLRGLEPDAIYHLAIASRSTGRENESWEVNFNWSSELAWASKVLNIPFVFASTAMVYALPHQGPYTMQQHPNASEGYGFEKRMAENQVRMQNPQARIVRLGWQIDFQPSGNTMLDFLLQKNEQHGMINASRAWYPAASFLDDTVRVLENLLNQEAGVYMADSNTGWNMFQIVQAINSQLHANWFVQAQDDYVHDQRLIDPRLHIPPLSARLHHLPNPKWD